MDFKKNLYLFILTFLILFSIACERFEGDQTIPSYIQVDTIILVDNPLIEEGALTHNFTDVWVYVDDQTIGAFELPTDQIPVLQEGEHKLTLIPGIKKNGISGTRTPYTFIEPFIIKDFQFVIDSIIKVVPDVQYYDSVIWFEWQENFEHGAGNISLIPTSNSDTSLQLFPREELQYGNAGAGYLNQDYKVLEVSAPADPSTAAPGFDLPKVRHVFLEIEYNTNNQMIVGLFIRELGVSVITHPIVVINSTDGVWKKMYVNLTPTVSDNYQADYFYVFIRSDKEASVESPILLIDNLKLIYNL
ncbi:MAG: hypothetical protein K8R86_05885 [Bacteroidales bacterium]|nr:hypothetical protein [Bacteroidales bacterium]